MKMQFDQLQESNLKIMDAQSQLQRELQRSRQETNNEIDARDQYVEKLSELAENMELVTLDKEMTEEKSDTLQSELEASEERCEELQLDLHILKAEMQKKTGDVVAGSVAGGEGITSYEYKRLEQQNTRLRDTLVRLCDLSAHEKHKLQKIAKELETKKSEVNELQRTKKKLSAKIDELEAQVVDLQEQVDAALGAEEMVEQLGEKEMELEDKVKLLEKEVAELEPLEEVHEQLAAKRDKLNNRNAELHDRAASNVTVKDNAITEAIDFNELLAEWKAHTRAIALQLRQIDLKRSNEHVRLVTAFMPETFLVMFLIVLIAGIIVGQAKERFQNVDIIDRNALVQGHAVQEFSFKSRLSHHVHNIQAVMHQSIYDLNNDSAPNRNTEGMTPVLRLKGGGQRFSEKNTSGKWTAYKENGGRLRRIMLQDNQVPIAPLTETEFIQAKKLAKFDHMIEVQQQILTYTKLGLEMETWDLQRLGIPDFILDLFVSIFLIFISVTFSLHVICTVNLIAKMLAKNLKRTSCLCATVTILGAIYTLYTATVPSKVDCNIPTNFTATNP
ncbi:hypothetical protein HA402_013359 [Bradysia odoriphaga]|nr:hypothetical protein HA402_013359 [Bradysia odoriphaga]